MSKQINENYNHKVTEKKWQKIWEEKQVFKFNENDSAKQKYYVLEMFPYPSGKIHMGHLRNYAIGDVIARFYNLQNYNVLHPMGFDAFGLPAENAALQHKIHPSDWTYKNIENMKSELKLIGLSVDWDRQFATCDEDYYKHEQEIFINFVKNGLAYQKESFVNWDPIDQTVLANEQVIDGRGWRSGALVEKKKLKQWFLKVSDFSEELLAELKNLSGWDERVLSMQEKWIGKSEGLLIDFAIFSAEKKLDEKLKIYTTRPDTLYGASFVGISPNHPLALELAKENAEIQDFINECNKSAVNEEALEKQEKKGFKTKLKAQHPLDENWFLDIYIANFVLMDYGTGAIFACPAHDQRDFEFAKKYDLPIIQVVSKDGSTTELKEAYLEEGLMINSKELDGLTIAQAKEKIAQILGTQGIAEKKVNYRLRDWGVSRQRYWGCPIPMLYLEDGSVVPVPKEELPVTLPKDVEFNGNGNPLAQHPTWKYTTYKGQKAIRETDTFDTFFESSWYFLRYISQPQNKAFERDLVNKFMPVDQYIGGIEHAVLHLLYARFFTKALKKCGYLDFDEPFKSLLTQGMVCHNTFKDKNGNWLEPSEIIEVEKGKFIHQITKEEVFVGRSEKMSKSKKNIVEPVRIVDSYGADTARLFMLSDSPPARDLEWSDSGIDGAWKYINRLWRLVTNFADSTTQNNKDFAKFYDEKFVNSLNANQIKLVKLTHRSIAQVKEQYQNNIFNKAIAKIREFSNAIEDCTQNDVADQEIKYFALNNLVILISPIMPHLAEELWQKLGNSEILSKDIRFPDFNANLITENEVSIAVQINGKLRTLIQMAKDTPKDQMEKIALENEAVKKFLEEKEVKKVITVPNKIVNIVAV